MVLVGTNLVAAPHSFLPIEATQPDGSRIHIYASGDEFHNWLHDEHNYTIVKDDRGAYVYAMQERGSLVPSDLLVGRDLPIMRNITPGLNLSRDEIKAKYDRYADMRDYSGRGAPHTGQLNNIVIFIKFSDSPDFSTPLSNYQQMFNAEAANSMKRYFRAASYNQLNVDSYFYPAPNGNIVTSYTDTYPRSYFQPHSASNPNGYSGDSQRRQREHALLKRAVDGVSAQIPTTLNVDGDGDGKVDNVCFIIQGATDGWADLLWPHQWSLYSVTATINGKRVWEFNFQLENSLNYSGASVLAHEMFHSLGAPDLYRYYDRTITPVGRWDLMASNLNPPQHMGTWMKHKYGQWVSNVPTITTSGTYTLHPVASSSTNNIYRINSWNADECYVLEYRKSDGTYDGNLPGTGLLVYRLNESKYGNADGPPDELYVYRPGGTNSVDGNLNQAFFSQQSGRTEISEATTLSGFLSDGSAGGLNLYDVGYAGETISFKVKISDIQLTYPHGGEVWNSGENKVITWKSKSSEATVEIECSSDGGQSWNLIATNVSNTGSFTWHNVASMNNSENVHIRVSLTGTTQSDSNSSPFKVLGSTLNPPNDLKATPGNGFVKLKCLAPLGGYPAALRVYRNGSPLATINGFTYTDYAIVNGTAYSYHVTAVYAGGESGPSNTAQAIPSSTVISEVVLGSGTDSTGITSACPINVYYKSLHGQSVYTKAELNDAGVFGPGSITQIGFNITGLPARSMPNYIIRMGHTTASDASNWVSTGLTQVWSSSSYKPLVTGWDILTLSTPFEWNGTDNIVVDTAFGLVSSCHQSGTVQYTNKTKGYCYVRSDDYDQTNAFNIKYTPSYRPNLKLTLVSIEQDNLFPGVDYPVGDIPGATFNSNDELSVVEGVDESTPAIAALPNLNPANAFIAGYSGTGSNVSLTFNISTEGTYYLIGYWGGSWHQATPFPLVVSSGTGTVTLSGIDFTAKGDVYVVLSNSGDPATLPVELSHFSATVTAENFVQLTWTSQTESNLLGYNVYRSDAADLSSARKISELIEGTNTSIAQTYIYVDEELEQDGTYYYWLQNVELDGSVNFHGPASVLFSTEGGTGAPPIPLVTRLENAYPNPFNPATTIRYQLKDPAEVKIDIYNLKGQRVRSFVQSHAAPGYYHVIWDGCDSSGRALSSGVYLYKMSAGSYRAAKKIVLKK
jgi:M6 family metalloprotease-like protein